ncbi:MAG: IS1634 family transposase [Candidatus Riflebacteria bacterium]|nr:IS1634 family transposase [Candidatus Riflebacteria bacterium]
MYIRKVRKTNRDSGLSYQYCHLVENVRTTKGPRQRLILNLGDLDLPEDRFKELANLIESLLIGQKSLFPADPKIEKIAKAAVKKIFEKRATEETFDNTSPEQVVPAFSMVDTTSIESKDVRSFGPEIVCHEMWKTLDMDKILLESGVPEYSLPIIETLIAGRLIEPGSERHTFKWAEERSSIYELVGKPEKLSLSSFYRAGDILFKHKEKIESKLSLKEKSLFGLEEKLLLFDLTNTYFEGEAEGNSKAQRGMSKEKRSDAKLLTLALIVDSDGFAKHSQLFPGNQYEGKTLKTMIESLEKAGHDFHVGKTVVMDAGIANNDNIAYLQEKGLNYIVVSRGFSGFAMQDSKEISPVIKDDKGNVRIEIKRKTESNEAFLLCRSAGRIEKDNAIRTAQEKRFIERIDYFQEGLSKKGRMKTYSKIVEVAGRLRERYPQASKIYDVEVIAENKENPKNATKIVVSKRENYEKEASFDGCYVLRTDRLDLSDEEIWKTYSMLTRIERAFRALKSSLGVRPVFHHKEKRADAHLFISVMAYHLLQSIEWQLRQENISTSWSTVRKILSTHQRMTLEYTEKAGDILQRTSLRLSSTPETEQRKIYKVLKARESILPRKTNYLKIR